MKQIECKICGELTEYYPSKKYCTECGKKSGEINRFRLSVMWQRMENKHKTKCVICGDEFNAIGNKNTGTRKKYCSDYCKIEANRIRNRENKRRKRGKL